MKVRLEWLYKKRSHVRALQTGTRLPQNEFVVYRLKGAAKRRTDRQRQTTDYFFLCRFFLSRFFRLCVAILCRFRFLPQGMM